MLKKFVFLLLLSSVSLVFAQDRMLTIEDCEINSSLRPQGLAQLQWIPGTNKIAFVAKTFDGPKLTTFNAYGRTYDTVFTLAQFKNSLSQNGITSENIKAFPAIKWYSENSFWTLYDNKVILFNIITGTATVRCYLKEKSEVAEVASNSLNSAYVFENNVYYTTPGSTRQLTFDGGNGIMYGKSAHREEFGISKGLFWSNDGQKLAFYRQDERSVRDYPIYNLDVKPATSHTVKYPCAGDSSHTVTIGVYSPENGRLIYLNTEGPYDQYLTNVTWSPDDKYIYLAIVNREQNKMDLKRFNAEDGSFDRLIFSEENSKYVEPEHGPEFLTSDPDRFVWHSEKDGFNHLYLYNTSGKMLCQLTKGRYVITNYLGTPDGEIFYYVSTKESAMERHLYSIKISSNSNSPVKLSKNAGTHNIIANTGLNFFADIFSSVSVPRDVNVISSDGNLVQTIFSSQNPLKNFKLGETSLFPVMNGNTALYCRMIKPIDFDESKKYPVIVYVYGGPHAQLVNNTWLGGSNLWMQYMAQQGFIVFTLDNRGSDNRGFDFESAVHRTLGTNEMQDQMVGINYLSKLPYVDTSRIGVHGWSFGGFMTTTLMTKSGGIFKVGVAGGPVIDWKNYEIMYTERYMDRPSENVDGYDKANLLNFAQNLNGRLLIVHGTDDATVLWQHSLLYCKKAVELHNPNLDYFVYPGHEHNVFGPDRVHLMKKITQYFIDFL